MSKTSLISILIALIAMMAVAKGAELLDDTPPDEDYLDDSQAGWSEWSEWSPCSRTCGGGAAVQSRRCLHYDGCRGDSVRYQLCNTTPCAPGSKDFRSVQCSEYDGLPHEGRLYEWEPVEGVEQCALTCHARGGGPVVTLNPRVRDGTRCAPDSLDLCINGRCQNVGCDLRLGSKKTVDGCGVCGGDGSSCNKPSYFWDKRANSPCSATCGGGYQMLSAVCVEQGNGRRVSEELCDHAVRPIPVILNCNDDACPTSWQTGDWGPCSVSCGLGYQLREVYCAEPRNTSVVRVADHYCTLPRPPHRQTCNIPDCPRWYDGIWSQCSATCGDGVQTRVVLCRDAHGRSSTFCVDRLRPSDTRPCRTGISCPAPTTLAHPRHQPYTPAWWPEEQDAFASEEGVAPLMPRPQALTADQQVPAEPTYMTGNWSGCSVKCGEGIRIRNVTCKIFLEFSRTVADLPDDQCPGVKPPSSQRCVLPPCSHAMTRHDFPDGKVSDAAQNSPVISMEDAEEDTDDDHEANETPFLPRLVNEDLDTAKEKIVGEDSELSVVPQAQAYNKPHSGLHSFESSSDSQPQRNPLLQYPRHTGTHDHYDSYEVKGSKSDSSSQSEINAIRIDMGGGDHGYKETYHIDEDSNNAHTYQWKTSGFTPCSASCLGGVQESIVLCVRILDQKIVTPHFCNVLERPDVITRTCHDQPCPPRWSVSEFGNCSKPCGGGVQTREVNCIHEVTRGGTNTVEVPDNMCPQPPPRTQQLCNIFDCPPEWVAAPWSKCSAPCGGGVKNREVRCKQTLALGTVQGKPSRACPHRRPPAARKCNRRACHGQPEERRRPIIYAQAFQDYVQSKFMKKLTLKVGGKATVFRGVMVKIKCPVRRFDRSQITWWFENRQLVSSGAIRTTNKGVLKIRKVQYPHAGVYKCRADRSEANLTLVVKPLPSSYSSSEERERPGANSANEVSFHTYEDATNISHTFDEWNSNKSGKKKGRGERRRQGNRGKGRRRNKLKPSRTTQTTLRPIQPFPTTPGSGTLGEGPFKASSKNMHTVEVSSSEATNTFNPWQTNENIRKADEEYIYGTVKHHVKHTDWPDGWGWEHGPVFRTGNHLPEGSTGNEDRQHVYGTVNRHSDGSRITSEENHIFGTIRHSPMPELPETEVPGDGYRTEWPDTPTSATTYLPERNPVFNGGNGNSIESDLKDLGTKLNLGSDDSNQNLGTEDGEEDEHSWANTQDQHHHHHHHHYQQYDPSGTPHWHVEAPYSPSPAPPNTSSGSSRSVPYFQKLLSNLERSISSRGGRHASDDFGGMVSHDLVRDATTTEHPLGTPEILGKGTRDSLEFEWQMTNWSACSQTCGFSSTSTGFQVRSIQCLVRVNNVSRPVDGALCVDAGLEAPITIQNCGLTECPQWHFDEWSKCESSRCFTLNYAFQRRDVVCQLHNGTIVSSSQCDDRTRPRHRRECYNKHCTGVWRVGDWSECTAPCGGQGYRTRLLQCVWNGTKKAAGNACRGLPRPEVVRWCDGDPCPDPSM